MKKLKTFEDMYKMQNHMEIDHYTLKFIQEATKEWLEYVDKFDRNGRTYSELRGLTEI